MTRISILDPTASPPEVDPHPGPEVTDDLFSSGRIGIRYDLTWRSFDWVRDEWSQLFSEAGTQVSQWCAGDRTGEAAALTLTELKDFSSNQQAVISGLGN